MTTVPYRRKREGRTNYKKRLAMLKSRTPRLVIRKTNRQIILQIVEYSPKGDKIFCAVQSSSLKKLGWSQSFSSIPAAYLAGKLLSSKAKEKKHNFQELIVDIGLHTPVKGNRLYSAVKGVVDGGLKVNCSEEIFPKEDRMHGKHIEAHAKLNKARFTKTNPEKISEEFKKISQMIK